MSLELDRYNQHESTSPHIEIMSNPVEHSEMRASSHNKDIDELKLGATKNPLRRSNRIKTIPDRLTYTKKKVNKYKVNKMTQHSIIEVKSYVSALLLDLKYFNGNTYNEMYLQTLVFDPAFGVIEAFDHSWYKDNFALLPKALKAKT